MEEILFISTPQIQAVLDYCEVDLLFHVLEDFHRNHPIMYRENRFPLATWVISSFIDKYPIEERRDLLSVLLSFAAVNGIIRYKEANCQGDANLLKALWDNGDISVSDFEYFNQAFDNFSHGVGVRFKLDNK